MKPTNHFPNHRRITTFAVRLCVVSAILVVAAAPAPRGSIQYAGLVLKKLDESNPPSYPNVFWRDRVGLTTDVAAVINVMADSDNADPETWCSMIEDIFDFATLTNAYFDIAQNPNPALDDFKKDWLKVMQLSGCFD